MTPVWVQWNGTNGATAVNGTNAEQFIVPGGSAVYDNTHVVDGTMALKITPAASAEAAVLVKSGLNTPQLALTVPNYYQSVSTADTEIIRFEDTANTKMMSLVRATSGHLSITDKYGTSPRLFLAANNEPINQWVKAKIFLQIGSTATAGTVTAQFLDSTNTIIGTAAGGIDSPGFTTTAANIGTTNIGRFFIGRTGSQTDVDARWFGTLGYDVAATGLLPNYGVTPLTGSGTLTDNTATLAVSPLGGLGPYSYSISPLSGVVVSDTVNGIFTVQKDPVSTLTYTVTVTDSQSNTANVTFSVPPIPAGSTGWPKHPVGPVPSTTWN